MWWFDSWSGVLRVLLVGPAAYALLVIFLRVSGKRTLSKLNAFDLVVTVAMGSTLAAVLLDQQVPLAEGVAAFLVLIFGQFVVAKLSVRSRRFARLVRAEPRVLLWQGRILASALDEERVTRAELQAALRAAGCSRVEDAGAVVIETDGSLNVVREVGPLQQASSFEDVKTGS